MSRAAPVRILVVAVLALAFRSFTAGSAHALTLELQSEEEPWPGITIREYRTSDPGTNTFVALVDLCSDHVHVSSTYPPSGLQSTGGWADDEGVQLATNGDFYKTGPVRVYGNAVGRGVQWPLEQTGDDPGYSWEWFYERYGWIAFGHDSVEFTHSEAVKLDPGLSLAEGWMNETVAPTAPTGTLALVSGFPELVIEGVPVSCPSPTDDSCFPDRTDMRSRHPRTAMGLTADRETLILAVVDGRTASSSGMYGLELTDLMFQLGAHVAFNLDGGGSAQMWAEGDGYINDVSGNNSGGGTRSVANHWGIQAGFGSGSAARPGHCVSRPPCAVIGPGGGTIDDDSACFATFGPDQYWREESVGEGGHLYWTNAFDSDLPSNWAWWQLHLEEAGEYLVEFRAEPEFAVYFAAPYLVRAGGDDHELAIDQGAAVDWGSLGTFDFDAGGGQFVAVFDNTDGSVASDQHVVADAIRLTRVGSWCGDGACDADEDCDLCPEDCTGPEELPDNGLDDDCDGEIDETSAPDDDDATDPPDDDDSAPTDDDDATWGDAVEPGAERRNALEGGCSCNTRGAAPSSLLPLFGLVLATRTRRSRLDPE